MDADFIIKQIVIPGENYKSFITCSPDTYGLDAMALVMNPLNASTSTNPACVERLSHTLLVPKEVMPVTSHLGRKTHTNIWFTSGLLTE